MLKKVASKFAKVLALVAATEASTACMFFFYQPKAPKQLQK